MLANMNIKKESSTWPRIECALYSLFTSLCALGNNNSDESVICLTPSLTTHLPCVKDPFQEMIE